MPSAVLGFVLASASAVLNGSFVVFSKLPSVKRAGVDPLVFQLWSCVGVFLSSLLCMPFIVHFGHDGHGGGGASVYPLEALGWGILAGGLFVVAVAFSFVAVQLVGLSVAQGIWSGSAVLVSFAWGVAAFDDAVRPAVAGAGVGLIVLGVVGIALCADIAAVIDMRFGRSSGADSAADQDGRNVHARGSSGSGDGEELERSYGHNGVGSGGGSFSPLSDGSNEPHHHQLHHSTARVQDAAGPPRITVQQRALLERDGTLTPVHERARHPSNDDLGFDPQAIHPAAAKARGIVLPPPTMLLVPDPLDAHTYQQQQRATGALPHMQQQQQHPSGSPSSSSPSSSASSSMSFPASASASVGASGSASYHQHYDGDDDDVDRAAAEEEEIAAATARLVAQRRLYGSVCALVVGLFGGSILMPLQMAPSSVRGLEFVPSFGLGTLFVAPLITLPYMWLSRSSGSRGHWAVRETFLPGLAAGAVWNAANVCSIFATKSLGYAVAYPLMQCAIVVAAAWGILVFKEMKGRPVRVMMAAATIVLAGAVVLALSRK
jgi:glucose uptake protein GlcU